MTEKTNQKVVIISIWVSMVIQSISVIGYCLNKFAQAESEIRIIKSEVKMLLDAHRMIGREK